MSIPYPSEIQTLAPTQMQLIPQYTPQVMYTSPITPLVEDWRGTSQPQTVPQNQSLVSYLPPVTTMAYPPLGGQLVSTTSYGPPAIPSSVIPASYASMYAPPTWQPAPTPVLTKSHPNPARQYVCDGYNINDEVGNNVAKVVVLPKNKGTDIVSPAGEPWLRYEKQARAVRDLRTNKVFALVGTKEKCIYWGFSPHWKMANESTMSVSPKLYTYNIQEEDGVNLYIWVYDAKTRRHVATITRLSSGAYPSRIAIQPNTPYHLLLCTLFLI